MIFSEWLAIVVNLLVAAYLIHFYPKTQAKIFQGVAIPRGLLLLRRGAKIVGYVIVVASLGYIIYRLFMS